MIDDLGREQFSRPDEEHRSVSVSRKNGWGIEADLYGLVRCGKDNSKPTDVEYFSLSIPFDRLPDLFLLVARDQIDDLMVFTDWTTDFSKLPPRGRPVYLGLADKDRSLLHAIASYGDVEWAREVIAAGNNVNEPSEYGETPLHLASLAAHFEMCEFLLQSGADVNAADRDGETPLDYAIDDDWEFDGLGDRVRALLINHDPVQRRKPVMNPLSTWRINRVITLFTLLSCIQMLNVTKAQDANTVRITPARQRAQSVDPQKYTLEYATTILIFFDEDRDGHLNREEARKAAWPHAEKVWFHGDKNRDNRVSRQELKDEYLALFQRTAKAGGKQTHQFAEENWRRVDKDRDGRISREEARNSY